MKYFEWTVILLFTLSSCRQAEKFPEYVTLPLSYENISLTADLNRFFQHPDSTPEKKSSNYFALDSLMVFKKLYFQRNEAFHLERFQQLWNRFRQQSENSKLTKDAALKWFDITGFIFELTGNALIAEELGKISVLHLSGLQPAIRDSLITPYILTKSIDHIWVNLFLPVEINFTHSLDGEVTVTQDTDFPESGSIRLNFGMETKRHIEVYVRIPSWIDEASVTVKKVKYFAEPGSYCLISKKWKDGDVVEIEFFYENLPKYLKKNI